MSSLFILPLGVYSSEVWRSGNQGCHGSSCVLVWRHVCRNIKLMTLLCSSVPPATERWSAGEFRGREEGKGSNRVAAAGLGLGAQPVTRCFSCSSCSVTSLRRRAAADSGADKHTRTTDWLDAERAAARVQWCAKRAWLRRLKHATRVHVHGQGGTRGWLPAVPSLFLLFLLPVSRDWLDVLAVCDVQGCRADKLFPLQGRLVWSQVSVFFTLGSEAENKGRIEAKSPGFKKKSSLCFDTFCWFYFDFIIFKLSSLRCCKNVSSFLHVAGHDTTKPTFMTSWFFDHIAEWLGRRNTSFYFS